VGFPWLPVDGFREVRELGLGEKITTFSQTSNCKLALTVS
jgi:hypothetical protein